MYIQETCICCAHSKIIFFIALYSKDSLFFQVSLDLQCQCLGLSLLSAAGQELGRAVGPCLHQGISALLCLQQEYGKEQEV